MQNELFAVAPLPIQQLEAHTTARLGRIAELRSQVHLIERGHDVSVPAIDSGIDLWVNGGISVQIKSSRLSPRNGGTQQVYAFRFKRHLGAADIYILYGYEDDLWVVAPREVIVPLGQTINLGRTWNPNPGGQGRPSKSHTLHAWRDRWDLFDATHQDRDAANHPSPPRALESLCRKGRALL